MFQNVTQEDLSGIDLDSTAPASEAKDSSSDSTSADGDLDNLDDLDNCLEAELRLRELANGELNEDVEPQEITKSHETVCDSLAEHKNVSEDTEITKLCTKLVENAEEIDGAKKVDSKSVEVGHDDLSKSTIPKLSRCSEGGTQKYLANHEVNHSTDHLQSTYGTIEKSSAGNGVPKTPSGTPETVTLFCQAKECILSDTFAFHNGNNAIESESSDSGYLPPIPPVGWRHGNELMTRGHHKLIEGPDHHYNNNGQGGGSEMVGCLPHLHQGDFISRKLSSEDGNYVTLDFSRSFFPRMVHRPITRKSEGLLLSSSLADEVATIESSKHHHPETNGRVDLGLPIQKSYSEMIDARIVSAALGGNTEKLATFATVKDYHAPSLGKLLGMSPMQPTRNHIDLSGEAASQNQQKVSSPLEESLTDLSNECVTLAKESVTDFNPSILSLTKNVSGKLNGNPRLDEKPAAPADKVLDGMKPGIESGNEGRTFSLSSEPTECVDGADIISVISDEGDKMSPVGMPSVADGLSDNEDETERIVGKASAKKITTGDRHGQHLHKNKRQVEVSKLYETQRLVDLGLFLLKNYPLIRWLVNQCTVQQSQMSCAWLIVR